MKHYRFRRWRQKHMPKLSATQIIAIAFALIILIGTGLLMLPVSAKDGQSTGFLDCLFTATSATCVTGLVPFDTGSHWSGFGQSVILTLIELGGLGFMSIASLFVFLFRRRVGLKQRMIMAQALSLNEMDGVIHLQKWVLGGSLSIQGLGALVLFFRFLPEFGVGRAAWYGVFHSVSAFCNAGFDIFGYGDSVMRFQSDPVVLITIMVLVAVGGLGFFVWEEVARLHSWRKFSVYTKLVLLASLVLTLGGAAAICLTEWNNPETLGNLSTGDKILGSFFQSVTVRTAGFDGLDQAGLTGAGKGISMVLMLIGGSSGSTAGGLKTVTMVVIVLFVWARARGRSEISVFKHSIHPDKVMDAMSIAGIMVGLAFFGGIFISATSPGVEFTDGLFESVSALATVGLTSGATPLLSVPAQLMIVIFMYFGRVGVLTLSLGFLTADRAEGRFRYAYTSLLIG